jgi:hypothetical protein
LQRIEDFLDGIAHFESPRKNPVPHPFAFFLAKGWDTTNLNKTLFRTSPNPKLTHTATGRRSHFP